MFCAAGMRLPVEQIAKEYESLYDVHVQLQFGGSNTLLSQIAVNPSGDLYLAADESYIDLAREQSLVQEEMPLADMRPVIAVAMANPKSIQSVDDLTRSDVLVALGNPDQAAIGRRTRSLLKKSGDWDGVQGNARVLKPTVNDVANDVKLGSVDAGIIWDATCQQYDGLKAIRVPELDAGAVRVTLGVLANSKHPTAALRFARFLTSRDRGLTEFKKHGFDIVDGDVWDEKPQLTFFAGSVNRRALEPIVQRFAEREGVEVNTIYNGCGILTAQMRSMHGAGQSNGFPDAYMACDMYYLDTVQDLFEGGVRVSNTDIVLVVQRDNPKSIHNLQDLLRPGVRVAIGQPEQCTIGVLTKRLLEQVGIYDELLKENVVTQTATSALLVPSVTTGAADVVIAYRTDTLAERDKLDVIAVSSPLARAIQPFSVSRSSDFKHLGDRLFQAISTSRREFEAAGFNWVLHNGPRDEGTGP